MTIGSFSDFPEEIQWKIFQNLDESLLVMTEVSKNCRRLASDPSVLKIALTKRHITPIKGQEQNQFVAACKRYCAVFVKVLGLDVKDQNLVSALSIVNASLAAKGQTFLDQQLMLRIDSYIFETETRLTAENEMQVLLLAGAKPDAAYRNSLHTPLSRCLQTGISSETARLLLRHSHLPVLVKDLKIAVAKKIHSNEFLIELAASLRDRPDLMIREVYSSEDLKFLVESNLPIEFYQPLIEKWPVSIDLLMIGELWPDAILLPLFQKFELQNPLLGTGVS